MGIIAAFIIALVIAVIFMLAGRRYNSFGAVALFFLLLFFAGVAATYWIIPVGPVWWGVSWLPLVFFVLVVAFLLSVQPPYYRSINGKLTPEDKEMIQEEKKTAASMFIWLLLIMFVMAAIVGFYK